MQRNMTSMIHVINLMNRSVPSTTPTPAVVVTVVVVAAGGAWVRVSKISKIGKFLQIFGGLVLGSIKTKSYKKICV